MIEFRLDPELVKHVPDLLDALLASGPIQATRAGIEENRETHLGSEGASTMPGADRLSSDPLSR